MAVDPVPPEDPVAGAGDVTSVALRNATQGDRTSLGWLIDRFSPLLRVQADHRLRGRLRVLYDPDDLVADVWAIVIPKLPTITVQDRRITPVFVRFLSTTLLNRFGTLLQKHIQGKPGIQSDGPNSDGDLLSRLSAGDSGMVTKAARGEIQVAVRAAVQSLEPEDREIVILRGIEQVPNQEVALRLGLKPNTVAARYLRALRKLRELVPGTAFDELSEDESGTPGSSDGRPD